MTTMEIKLFDKSELQENLQGFCDLYHKCFSNRIDTNVVKQRYLENPIDELQMCVALSEGNIVANYAVSPSYVTVGEKRFKSAMALNTMTHPDFLGQGLFVQLAQKLCSQLKDDNYDMIYAFPNYISNRIFINKLNWRNIYEIPTLELIVERPIEYQTREIIEKESPRTFVNYNSNKIHIDKNSDYLCWRYEECPNNKYYFIETINGGWCIYKYYENIINVVDYYICENRDVHNIIGYLTEMALKNKKDRITIWSSINSNIHLVLEKLGFRNRYPITYFAAIDLGLNEKINLDVFDYRNWIIQMGDDNVY